MCTEMNCSLEEFHDLINKSKSVSLLNIDDANAMSRGDKKLMVNLMEHSRQSNPFSAVNYKRAQEIIKDGIKTLPEKQRLVLSLYYFEDLNLKEIGQVLDVTESRVSQLHTQAILKLKAKLKVQFDSHEDLAS
jgi:RNA polymerase sigma factor for flagellar operon FliA